MRIGVEGEGECIYSYNTAFDASTRWRLVANKNYEVIELKNCVV
jgi:hypothetical protein